MSDNHLAIIEKTNIRTLREQCIVKRRGIADLIGMHRSNYSKIENRQREISVSELERLGKFYGLTVDQVLNLDRDIPTEVVIEDKTLNEQMRLIAELDDGDRAIIFRTIDKMLTSKKFKDFLKNNVAAL